MRGWKIAGTQGRLAPAAHFEGGALRTRRIAVIEDFMTFAADDLGLQIKVGNTPESQYFKFRRNHKNSAVEGVDRP